MIRMLAGARRTASLSTTRAFSTVVPQVPGRRATEEGTGGQASEAGLTVAVFGARGLLGTSLCSKLGSSGYLTYFGNRGCELEMRHLKVMYDLGRTRFVFYSPKDRESIREVIGDADVVVNLIGKYHETWRLTTTEGFPYLKTKMNYTYEDVNIDIPRTIAEVCVEQQVDHLIHVSSAIASPESSSRWARTKWEGEQALKEVFPWATIVRPTQMFAPEDVFLNWFAEMANFYKVIPLVDGGQALTQPVFVQDVSKCIMKVLENPTIFEGRYVDCFGPKDYSYEELVKFVLDITEQTPKVLNVPKPLYLKLAKFMQYAKGPLTTDPMIVPDLVEQWSNDYLPPLKPEEYKLLSKKDQIFTMEDLGVKATPIERIAFQYLHRFRFGGKYMNETGYH